MVLHSALICESLQTYVRFANRIFQWFSPRRNCAEDSQTSFSVRGVFTFEPGSDAVVAEAYDSDGSGAIDQEEFAELLEACKPDMTREERDKTFAV